MVERVAPSRVGTSGGRRTLRQGNRNGENAGGNLVQRVGPG